MAGAAVLQQLLAAGAAAGVAPANTAIPTVSGTPAVDQVLTAADGTWTGTPTPTLTRTWQADGVDIAGATGTTYTVQAAQVGALIRVRVTGTNASGNSSANSATTAAVAVSATKYPTAAKDAGPYSAVLAYGGGGGSVIAAFDPDIWRNPSTGHLWMVYTDTMPSGSSPAGVRLATSSNNGTSWTVVATLLDGSGEVPERAYETACLFYEAGVLHLFASRYNFPSGVPAIYHWTINTSTYAVTAQNGGAAVLSVQGTDEAVYVDQTFVQSPSIVKFGATYCMIYCSADFVGSNVSNPKISLATSTNLNAWTKQGDLTGFTPTAAPFDAFSEAVVKQAADGLYHMWVTCGDAVKYIYHATSQNPSSKTSWTLDSNATLAIANFTPVPDLVLSPGVHIDSDNNYYLFPSIYDDDAGGFQIARVTGDLVDVVVPTGLSVTLSASAIMAGQSITANPTATGATSYLYEWRDNGVPISGGTSATLVTDGLWGTLNLNCFVTPQNAAGNGTGGTAAVDSKVRFAGFLNADNSGLTTARTVDSLRVMNGQSYHYITTGVTPAGNITIESSGPTALTSHAYYKGQSVNGGVTCMDWAVTTADQTFNYTLSSNWGGTARWTFKVVGFSLTSVMTSAGVSGNSNTPSDVFANVPTNGCVIGVGRSYDGISDPAGIGLFSGSTFMKTSSAGFQTAGVGYLLSANAALQATFTRTSGTGTGKQGCLLVLTPT